jgi:DNA-binding transcriptional regulator YiaG
MPEYKEDCMPNIATVLKEEITRLARKELRQHTDPLRAQVLAQRKAISALKQEIERLQRDVVKLAKSTAKDARIKADSDPSGSSQSGRPSRYSGALLRKLRERLDLSRDAFAPLIGASPQAVYNWEQTQTRPRQEFLDKIALIRGLSKAQVAALLEQHSAPKAAKKATKKVAKKKAGRAKAASGQK